ncbi:MAG TPA: tripartite tricarboxylate transporter substrate binding protein [Xanthobacteraceae bacterium]|nr:tripartite tricarboxylate transporter substrate binding protein [Xanthobacteraceae bacterium]
MTISRRDVTKGLSVAAGAALIAKPAIAQSYPSGDVHFVCGFAAGSGADVIVRWYTEKLRPLMGKNIIVENRPGALSNIGTQYVMRAKPDGHTILVNGGNSVAANMSLLSNPGPNPVEALQMVGTLNRSTMMIGVRADSPIKTIQELTAAMKEKGDKASYAYANPASRVIGALYRERAGLAAVEVPYKTGAEFLNDLYSGNIDYAVPDNILGLAQLRAGRMRLLAVGSGTRLEAASDIPTLTESGYAMDVRSWWCMLVPKATPRPIVDQLNTWINQIASTPEAKEFCNSIAADPWVTKPEEGQAYLAQQIKDWAEFAKIAKIEPQ